jgi:hypothetical protein
VEEATEQIIQYLNPRTTSIRIDEKLRSEE